MQGHANYARLCQVIMQGHEILIMQGHEMNSKRLLAKTQENFILTDIIQ